MAIEYRADLQLELWVRDLGLVEGFSVFLDGIFAQEAADDKKHTFPIPRSATAEAIAVHFGGADGGITAVVDVSNPAKAVALEQLGPKDGMRHSYVILPEQTGKQPEKTNAGKAGGTKARKSSR